MTTATELFEGAMEWLREHYKQHRFFTERDVVWVLQLQTDEVIRKALLPYRVFTNHTVSAKPRVIADLVILDSDNSVEVAVEFKYEPSHNRKAHREGGDIWPSKLDPSAVFWSGQGSVEKDVVRAREFVEAGRAKVGYSVFIDEGGHFRRREPFEGSRWTDWEDGMSVLCASFGG